jgi:hypothetical protein
VPETSEVKTLLVAVKVENEPASPVTLNPETVPVTVKSPMSPVGVVTVFPLIESPVICVAFKFVPVIV